MGENLTGNLHEVNLIWIQQDLRTSVTIGLYDVALRVILYIVLTSEAVLSNAEATGSNE